MLMAHMWGIKDQCGRTRNRKINCGALTDHCKGYNHIHCMKERVTEISYFIDIQLKNMQS